MRFATRLIAGSGERARLSTFIFHRVAGQRDPLQPDIPTAEEFEHIVTWISRQFRVLPAFEACSRLFDGTLPAGSAAITFDDGYRDNVEIALPILQRLGVHATFFIATSFLDGGTMFNDRVIEAVRATRRSSVNLDVVGAGRHEFSTLDARLCAIPVILAAVKHLPLDARERAVCNIEAVCEVTRAESPMMTRAMLRALVDAGMEVGGHTHRHPILRLLSDSEAYDEMLRGRDEISAVTGTFPRLFAYPNGKFGADIAPRDLDLARAAGFSFAFTTEPGSAGSNCSPFGLPRFTPWDRTRIGFAFRNLRNLLRVRAAAPASEVA